jgi:ZIP family zinc transporter
MDFSIIFLLFICQHSLIDYYPVSIPTVLAFPSFVIYFSGIFLIAVIDNLIPSYENPHEAHGRTKLDRNGIKMPGENLECDQYNRGKKLLRTGVVTAIIIAVHNFPEGMATFVTSVHQPSLGIAVAAAIAIHNIPEGVSVAIPVYCATGSKLKALGYSLISGIGEPLGALLAYLFLMPFLNDTVFGIIFAAIAGIMVFISLDELLPTAREYGEHHLSIYGLIGGMLVMAVGLLLLT